jgi:hypothetical protein
MALLLTGLVAVGLAAGFAAASILERGPCHGAGFVSSSFGYCVETPTGWSATHADDGETGTDVFRNLDGATVVLVEAVRHGNSLGSFAETVRRDDSLAGFALGEVRSGELDGSPTLEWDVRISSDTSEIVMHEIVVLREGVAWRLQIAEEEGATSDGVEEAERLVDSWRFA